MTGQFVGVRAAGAPVLPTPTAISRLRPVQSADIGADNGFWGRRLTVNRERTIPHGFAELERVGTLANFRLAAGEPGRYQALGVMFNGPFPFLDSDVYKWLEGVGWELGRGRDPEMERMADVAIGLIARAQREDGYVNTFVQVVAGGREYQDLAWGHELYCVGHLIQAGIAWHRSVGDDRLLEIARRAADHVDRALGPSGREAIEGHPGLEMALVELFRVTGERRYLDLAAVLVERRGHGLLHADRFGSEYWQDHATVREATSVAGHAVRQLYLDCGAVDVATELGDTELLDAVLLRWKDMIASHSYLTGGLGSRHSGEAFGDPYELPPDRAYAETCAAIAGVMLAWRLLLATGDPDCADAIERTIHNGVLSGISGEGTHFFYVNPLQRRTVRAANGPYDGERATWYACACCPPNLMRLFSSWEGYLATADDSGVQIHQYGTAELAAQVAAGSVRLAVETGYPWDGTVTVQVLESPEEPWSLSLRVPGWCDSASVRVGSAAPAVLPKGARAFAETRTWRAGDSVTLSLEMAPRVTEPHPRVDAIRGCVALERGPLVYCVEAADLPDGWTVEDVTLPAGTQPKPVPRPDVDEGAVALAVTAIPDAFALQDVPHEIQAIPYFAWARRSPGGMRVWIPLERPTEAR